MLMYSEKIKIGWKAQTFKLKSVSKNFVDLKQIRNKNGFVVAFICNHCPYVKDLINRIVEDFSFLKTIDYGTVAIMSNDFVKYKEDSFENMQIFSQTNNFTFPYLIDNTQNVAKKYNAICTPDFFCFDREDKLFYRGRLDDLKFGEANNKKRNKELVDAVIQKIEKNVIIKNQKNSMGCSIKWKNY